MKIEKINDRQIRCTLTKEDLASREIKLSELAYGSDKAKALFQDMMQQAAEDFGFEAENMPLVVEAIPVSMETIVLIITKVDDPEELDTRFARFSPETDAPASDTTFPDLKDKIEGADDVLGLIRRISEAKKHAARESSSAAPAKEATQEQPAASELLDDEDLQKLTRFYIFRTLDDVIHVSAVLGSIYNGPNALYKNPENGSYYLILRKANSTAEQFNKVCNILSEYADIGRFTPGLDAHFAEHMETIIAEQALQKLSSLA